jgi:uncharacterized tellurite resistance protein B-like protein
MSIIDLYHSSEHRRNLAHFSAIVNLALTDGSINPEEDTKLAGFAHKLGISLDEFKEIVANPAKYPLIAPVSSEMRTERLYDFFRIIYADHIIDEHELELLHRYAIGLGYTSDKAEAIIQKSIKIFGGGIDFEDYLYLVDKK